jgi:hypothetical protein
MNGADSDYVTKAFGRHQYREVIRRCESLHPDESMSVIDRQWLLKHLGIAKIRLGKVLEGIAAIMEAVGLSEQPDPSLWPVLGEAFEQIHKVACAGKCYRLAAATDAERRSHWERRAKECDRVSTSPEDIAVSEVFFSIQGHPSIYNVVQEAKNDIDACLYGPRWAGQDTFLHILREHSSFTPIMKGRGGGCLLMHRGKGCVIDPGHGFIRNFLGQGYGFGDIHAIVVTHAHDDHVMELPAIASILHKAKFPTKVDLYLDETSYRAFSGHYLLASAGIRRQPILRPGQLRRVFENDGHSLDMDVYCAQHEVPILTGGRSPSARRLAMGRGVGVGFRLGFPQGREQYLLMPSDTGWNKRIAGQYVARKGCDAVLVHVSSIQREADWQHLERKAVPALDCQHLGVLGVIQLIRTVEPRVVLLGEKGAELDAVWQRLADVIRTAFRDWDITVCATEIGTKVTFDGKTAAIRGGYVAADYIQGDALS